MRDGTASLSRLRVAVLVETPCVSRYARDLIAWLQADPSITLLGVWHPASLPSVAKGGRWANRFRGWVYRWDARWAGLSAPVDPGLGLARVSAKVWHPDIPDIVGIASSVSSRSPAGPGPKQRVGTSWMPLPDCDLLIRAGAVPEAWCPSLAVHARYGVLGFDFSLSAPPDRTGLGFVECLQGEHQAGVVLYALAAGMQAPWVVQRGWFQPHWSLGRTRAMLLSAAVRMMKDAVLQCARWHSAETAASVLSSSALVMAAATLPSRIWPEGAQAAHLRGRELPPRMNVARVEPVPVGALLRYLGSTARRLLRKAVDRRKNRGYSWQLGFVQATHPATIDFAKVQPVGSPGRRFLADPFLAPALNPGEKPVVFVEEWAPRRCRGHISALEVDVQSVPGSLRPPRVRLRHLGEIIRTEHHLSFPFYFRWQGGHYICPESAASGRITVWRAKCFPTEWEPAAVLMQNVSAVDTMLFEAQGRWWMLTNLDRTGSALLTSSRDFHSELHLFHADSPLSSDWTPHPMNPLRVDSYGGRNAGMAASAEGVFRFGQLQAFDCYGHGLAIYRVTELSTTRYAEELVRVVTPSQLKSVAGLHGVHTLNQVGDLAVVDLLHRGGLRVAEQPLRNGRKSRSGRRG
ncbi:MAG: hypothetical protein Q4A16_07785 [Lautropia sp.]|nr:hypothetical protein [Lautropia sp.]